MSELNVLRSMGSDSTPRVEMEATSIAAGVDHPGAAAPYPSRMKTIHDIRRERLRQLIDEEFEGKQAGLCRRIDRLPQQVSAWLRAPDKPGAKNINDTSAREVEQQLGKRRGWLDTDPAAIKHEQPAQNSGKSHSVQPDIDKIVATVTLLSHYLEVVGLPAYEIRDPVLLETAYAVVEEFGQPASASNVLDLTEILARRIRGVEDVGQQEVGRARAATGK